MRHFENEPRLVAKVGGSPAARPDVMLQRLHEEGNRPDLVVISAPGRDTMSRGRKMTGSLESYERHRHPAARDAVLQQLTRVAICYSNGSIEDAIQAIVDSAPDEIERYIQDGLPLSAFGEKLSAQMFALATGRELIDASEVVRISDDGTIDVAWSAAAVGERFDPNHPAVMAGFIGADASGRLAVLTRGGSDISGAVAAIGIGAQQLDMWTDQNGVYRVDPTLDSSAELLSHVEYDRLVSHAERTGFDAFNVHAGRILAGTAIRTCMRNYKVPYHRGTIVVSDLFESPQQMWDHERDIA